MSRLHEFTRTPSIKEDSSDDNIADDYSEESESKVDDLNYYTEDVEMEIVTDVLGTYNVNI